MSERDGARFGRRTYRKALLAEQWYKVSMKRLFVVK